MERVKSLGTRERENKQKELTCPLCLSALWSPVKTPCEHTFCLECIKGWVEFREQRDPIFGRQVVNCPMCREDLGSWRPDSEAIETSMESEASKVLRVRVRELRGFWLPLGGSG